MYASSRGAVNNSDADASRSLLSLSASLRSLSSPAKAKLSAQSAVNVIMGWAWVS